MQTILKALALAALSTLTALAQTTPAAPAPATQPAAARKPQAPLPCDGVVVVVRVSEITPGGSIEKFMAAAAAHQAWYRAHGVMDNQIVTARISERDPETHAYVYSEKQVLAYHINPPTSEVEHDEAYAAFVKMYNETSHIKESFTTCMPKTVIAATPAK